MSTEKHTKNSQQHLNRTQAEWDTIRRELTEPRAFSAHFNRNKDCVEVELKSGVLLLVPTKLIEGVAGADPDLIDQLEMDKSGLVLNWEELGAGITVPNLARGSFGSGPWMDSLRKSGEVSGLPPTASEMGRKGGRARTLRKSAAARVNGKLGGRPRKKALV